MTLQVDDINEGLVSFIYNGSTWDKVAFNTTLAGTGWHHVAVTFSDSANLATLYLDGTAVSSKTITTSISYTLGTNSFIGKQGNGNTEYDFNGKIDDARIYTRALTAAEIKELANDLPLTDTDTLAVTINPVNDAPVFTNLNGAPTYTENGVPVALNTSWALAPPFRASVSVAPLKLLAAERSASATVTSASSTAAAPFSI